MTEKRDPTYQQTDETEPWADQGYGMPEGTRENVAPDESDRLHSGPEITDPRIQDSDITPLVIGEDDDPEWWTEISPEWQLIGKPKLHIYLGGNDAAPDFHLICWIRYQCSQHSMVHRRCIKAFDTEDIVKAFSIVPVDACNGESSCWYARPQRKFSSGHDMSRAWSEPDDEGAPKDGWVSWREMVYTDQWTNRGSQIEIIDARDGEKMSSNGDDEH